MKRATFLIAMSVVASFLLIGGMLEVALAQDGTGEAEAEETVDGSGQTDQPEEMENAGSPDVVVIPLDDDEDGDEEGSDGSGFIEIESGVGTQSVISNKIPLVVKITPSIDSSKAQISWDIPRGLGTSDEVEEWFRMEADTSRTFSIEVEPLNAGTFSIVVDVTAWRYDTNYVTSSVLKFEVDDNLVVTPQPDDYKRNKMMYTAAVLLGIVLLIIAAIVGVKFGISWFRKWMSED